MSRVKLIAIGPVKGKADDFGRTWHPVTFRRAGKETTVDVLFAVVNGRVSWGADQCSEQVFEDLVRALSAEVKVRKLLGVERAKN